MKDMAVSYTHLDVYKRQTSDLFKEFPTLRFLIPHGGGAVPYHWGRFRGLAQELKKPLLSEHLLNNIYFDTCVYHQPGIDLLNTVIPVKNVLFASEMIGAVRGIDPETGHYYDDTKRYIAASKLLSDAAVSYTHLDVYKRQLHAGAQDHHHP